MSDFQYPSTSALLKKKMDKYNRDENSNQLHSVWIKLKSKSL